jgi:hypothetical protein
MKKKLFADVEVDEEERQKFFEERREFVRGDNPDQSPEDKAIRQGMFDKLAELAKVVEKVKKCRKRK